MKKLFLFLAGFYAFYLVGGTASVQQFSCTKTPCKIALPPKMFDLGEFARIKGDSIVVTIPQTPNITNQTRGAVLRIDPRHLLGKAGVFRAEVRTREIDSDAKGPYWGGKILSIYDSAAGITYHGTDMLRGSSDWQPVSFSCPFNVQGNIEVVYGIQQGWGTIEFRNPTLEITEKTRFVDIKLPAGFRCEYTSELRNAPVRRGIMSPVPDRITGQDIRDLADWNVTLLRYQVVDGLKDPLDVQEYERWLDRCLDKLDTLMPLLAEKNIRVIIDMHFPPGGRYKHAPKTGSSDTMGGEPERFRMMDDPVYREAFLAAWKKIAARYRDNPNIYGYDLMNEPVQRRDARFNWLQLQYDAACAIRKIDGETPVIVENNYMCAPYNFDITPFPLKNIIYQIHMYIPVDYTHQGLFDLKNYTADFAGRRWNYRDRGWNKERLRQVMAEPVEFQKKYGAKILVGEFSVVLWAPGGADYLADLISIFEDNRWDWCYHAFREFEGWSLEHDGVPGAVGPSQTNDRKKILLQSFKKNQ